MVLGIFLSGIGLSYYFIFYLPKNNLIRQAILCNELYDKKGLSNTKEYKIVRYSPKLNTCLLIVHDFNPNPPLISHEYVFDMVNSEFILSFEYSIKPFSAITTEHEIAMKIWDISHPNCTSFVSFSYRNNNQIVNEELCDNNTEKDREKSNELYAIKENLIKKFKSE